MRSDYRNREVGGRKYKIQMCDRIRPAVMCVVSAESVSSGTVNCLQLAEYSLAKNTQSTAACLIIELEGISWKIAARLSLAFPCCPLCLWPCPTHTV